MGNCNFKTENSAEYSIGLINRNMFNLHYMIGKGGFSRVKLILNIKVWRVENKRSREIYAMKIMSKFKIYHKKSIASVMNEKRLLENLRHR